MLRLFRDGASRLLQGAGSALAGATLAALFCYGVVTLANQSNTWSPTTGTVSGLALTNNYNNAFAALQTCNSGATAPTNDVSGLSVKGQCWLDTSTTPNTVRQYDGSNWTVLGWLDTTNHQWIANAAGGTGTVASNTTTDLGTVQNQVVSVSGTTTITSFGTTALTGAKYFINFTGILTLTHNGTSLILPNGGSNITTAVGDTAVAVALGSGNWRVVSYQLANGNALSNNTNIGATNLANSALGFNAPINLRINATVATNNLTLTLVGVNNATPSSSNPILVPFRDATIANGDPVVVSIQAATAMTISSGSTLGASNGVPFRGWIVLYNSSGTATLGVFNASTATQVFALAEAGVVSPTNGAGNSAGVQYSAAGVTANSAFRIIGYFEYSAGLATAGTYNIAPTTVQLFGPGNKKPGDVVQSVYAATGSTTSCNATSITVNTGNSATITPTSAINLVKAVANSSGITGSAGILLFQISRGTGPTLIGSQGQFGNITSGALDGQITNIALDKPATTSAQSYNVYCANGTATGTFNGGTIGSPVSSMILDEIMGALPEPANDDGSIELRMVG